MIKCCRVLPVVKRAIGMLLVSGTSNFVPLVGNRGWSCELSVTMLNSNQVGLNELDNIFTVTGVCRYGALKSEGVAQHLLLCLLHSAN